MTIFGWVGQFIIVVCVGLFVRWIELKFFFAWEETTRQIKSVDAHLAQMAQALSSSYSQLEEEKQKLREQAANAWEAAVKNDSIYWYDCHRLLDSMNVARPNDGCDARYDGMPGYYLRQRLGYLRDQMEQARSLQKAKAEITNMPPGASSL